LLNIKQLASITPIFVAGSATIIKVQTIPTLRNVGDAVNQHYSLKQFTKTNMKNYNNWKNWVLGVFILIFILPLSGCFGFRHKNELYYNYKVTIVEKGGYAQRNGKFTNVGNYFLVRSITDTTLYTELNGLNFNPLSEYYGSPLYWNKKLGDTLTFEYIRKDRFWKKTN